jgi:hypothetical protein
MTLYIVQSYIGQHEDAYTTINGIFDTAEQAEAVKREIEARMAANLDLTETPYDISQTDEEYDKWFEWFDLNSEAEDFRLCKVIEYELNKRIK